MRWIGLISGLMIAVAAAARVSAADAPVATPKLPPALFSRQTSFAIPFQVSTPESGGPPATAVELHVSTDRGATWRSQGKLDPSKKSFPFRAPSDGEYCFAVRTLDAAGASSPAEPLAPELRVIIDTELPRLEFTAEPGAAGEVSVRWAIADVALNLESLRVEYQPTGSVERWWRVSTPPLSLDKASGRCLGQVSFVPHVRTGVLDIRAEVADMAGNRAVTKAQLRLPGTPDPRPANEIANTPSPMGLPPRPRAETRWAPDVATQLPWVRPRPPADSRPVAATPPTEGPALEKSFPSAPSSTPVAPPTAQQLAPRDRASGAPPARPAAEQPLEELPPPLARRPAADPVKNPPRMLEVGPPRIAAGEAIEVNRPEEVPAGSPVTPGGDRPRRVNSTRFELEYDVESVGRSGIAKVEVWGTRDGGKTWSSLGVDDDNRSPIVANVPGEGLYGFRVSVLSGSGLGGAAPRAGEQPDLWIAVDLTRPTGRLTMVEQGTGDQMGEMLVRWEAGDNQLAERPITLSFSARKTGPWTIIASGLENSGKFSWRLDNRVPEQVHIRLEVRDDAGNVLDYVTPEPVAIERTVPKVRIRNVRPVAESAEVVPPGPAQPSPPVDPESAALPRRYRLY